MTKEPCTEERAAMVSARFLLGVDGTFGAFQARTRSSDSIPTTRGRPRSAMVRRKRTCPTCSTSKTPVTTAGSIRACGRWNQRRRRGPMTCPCAFVSVMQPPVSSCPSARPLCTTGPPARSTYPLVVGIPARGSLRTEGDSHQCERPHQESWTCPAVRVVRTTKREGLHTPPEWSGRRESNSHDQLGRLGFYH